MKYNQGLNFGKIHFRRLLSDSLVKKFHLLLLVSVVFITNAKISDIHRLQASCMPKMYNDFSSYSQFDWP